MHLFFTPLASDNEVQMGYGARALKALNSYYSGEYLSLDESMREEPSYPNAAAFDPVSTIGLDLLFSYERTCQSVASLTEHC